MPTHDEKTFKTLQKGITAAAVVLFGIHLWWASHFWTAVYLMVRAAAPWLLWLAAGAALIGIAAVLQEVTRAEKTEGFDGREYTTRVRRFPTAVIAAGWTVAGVAIVAGFFALFTVPYHTDIANRTGNLVFTDEEAPDFAERFPYGPAQGILERNPGDVSNVTVQDAAYTRPGQEWAALINGVGVFSPTRGVVSMTAREGGGVEFDNCEFDGEVAALGGNLTNRLERHLRKVKRNTTIEADAASVWCDDDGAHLLIPAERYHGVLRPHLRPAGVFYVAPDGHITFDDSPDPDLQAPLVSLSTARSLVDANLRLDRQEQNLPVSSVLFRSQRQGYERPETGVTSNANPDDGNPGELLVRDEEGTPFYITALTPLGADENISAVAVVPASELTGGELPEVTIYRLPEEQRRISNLEISDRLRVDYDATVQWEAGYRIFELAPLNDGTWSATIGQSLEVRYRAIVNPDGSSCLYEFDTGALVICSSDARGTAALDDDVATDAPAGQLFELSDEQLLELLEDLVEELSARQDDN